MNLTKEELLDLYNMDLDVVVYLNKTFSNHTIIV